MNNLAGMLAPPNMGKAYGDLFNPMFEELDVFQTEDFQVRWEIPFALALAHIKLPFSKP